MQRKNALSSFRLPALVRNVLLLLALFDAALRAQARRAMNATDDYVHDNPWSSIGAAAAIGMLVGVLLGRR